MTPDYPFDLCGEAHTGPGRSGSVTVQRERDFAHSRRNIYTVRYSQSLVLRVYSSTIKFYTDHCGVRVPCGVRWPVAVKYAPDYLSPSLGSALVKPRAEHG